MWMWFHGYPSSLQTSWLLINFSIHWMEIYVFQSMSSKNSLLLRFHSTNESSLNVLLIKDLPAFLQNLQLFSKNSFVTRNFHVSRLCSNSSKGSICLLYSKRFSHRLSVSNYHRWVASFAFCYDYHILFHIFYLSWPFFVISIDNAPNDVVVMYVTPQFATYLHGPLAQNAQHT